MATGEDDKRKEGKGFAGLSSLMSDVDTTPPPAAKKPTTNSTGTSPDASRPAPQVTPPKPQPTPQQPYKPPQQPGSGSSAGKWVVGIAAVIGVLWLIGAANKTTTTSSAPAYSPPAQRTTSSYSPPAQPQVPTHPAQSNPSSVNTGSDLMSGGDGAVYRVPSFRVAELENYKRAAQSAQREAENLESQVERQKNQLEYERQQVDQAQQELDELGGVYRAATLFD